MSFLCTMLAMAPTGQGGQTGNPIAALLPFFAIIIIMYLLMILPQQKKQKEHRKMLGNLQKGDKIITTGGIFGIVSGIKEKENTILLKISENSKIEILRSSVAQVLKN